MKIYEILLCIYLLLKPYYIFSSGGLQIGDVVLTVAFFFFIFNNGKIKKLVTRNKKFLLFVFLTFVINVIYYFAYYKFKFIISSLYYVFNIFIIFLFTEFMQEDKKLKIMGNIVKVNIVLQLIIFILGLGRYYNSTRYMGTFNDPNQFAYYIFTSYLILHMIAIKLKDRSGKFIFLLLSILLIVFSSSTGMTLGIGIFFILEMCNVIIKIPLLIKKNFGKIFPSVLIIVLIVSIFGIFINKIQIENINYKLDNITVLSRIKDKLSRIDFDNDDSGLTIWEERGYDKIYNQPYVILYGSGEAEYGRFVAAHDGEIHATLPSILFYYGIVPTYILISWIWSYIKNQKIDVTIVYIAMFMESFFLLNQRQAYFWILIIFGDIFKEKLNKMEEK